MRSLSPRDFWLNVANSSIASLSWLL